MRMQNDHLILVWLAWPRHGAVWLAMGCQQLVTFSQEDVSRCDQHHSARLGMAGPGPLRWGKVWHGMGYQQQ